MANIYLPCKSVAVAGTAGSTNLIAAVAGQRIRLWQLVASGTAADTTGTLGWTVAGTATSAKFTIGSAPTVLPATGVPWAEADPGTAITFTAAVTSTVTGFYTIGA
jgi:hypothetical protein